MILNHPEYIDGDVLPSYAFGSKKLRTIVRLFTQK
jgi:hypothetical protein